MNLNWQNQALPEQFSRRFKQLLSAMPDSDATLKVALAFSGGLDSSALLDLLNYYSKSYPLEVWVFHVHHGLSPNADDWLAHSQRIAKAYQFRFDCRKIHLSANSSLSLEAQARELRYQALGQMCLSADVSLLLTAHHKDDVLETSLMNFFNGAGMFGMAGIEERKSSFALLANPAVTLLRPLLQISRLQLAEYVAQRGLTHVVDESNLDQRFRRNLFRNTLIPQLTQAVPAISENVTRSIRHMQAAKRMLQQLAGDDFMASRGDIGLSLQKLRHLNPDRLDNLLRYWLDRHGLSMPTVMQLEELKRQILTSRGDATVEVSLQQVSFYIDSDQVVVAPRLPDALHDQLMHQDFVWSGESVIDFPEFHGRLRFSRAEFGLPEPLLRNELLCLHFRRGGEKLSLAANRPGRELKKQYQQMGIAYWQRARLPLLSATGKLVFAAGLGNNAKFCEAGESCYQLSWESDLMHLQLTELSD